MSKDEQTGFFGHPTGLRSLFFTELWERFSFYGLKAMLFLFITAEAVKGPQGGLGIDTETGGAIAGLYNSGVYLLALPGGWLADRLIGQRSAVLWGGIIIAAGHFCLAGTEYSHNFFYTGLSLIIVGTGLLKPNISTMVGDLYPKKSGARRDAGFSIFYMAINLGSFSAPLICGAVRSSFGWHYAFSLAGFGMVAGVIWYLMDQKSLSSVGSPPELSPQVRKDTSKKAMIFIAASIGIAALLTALHLTGIYTLSWVGVAQFMTYFILILVGLYLGFVGLFCGLDYSEMKRVLAIGILFLAMAMFWSAFEQSSTSLNAFARDITNRVSFGYEIPTEFLQAVNPMFIVALAPFFGALWLRLSAKNLNPSVPMKFALGLLQLSLGFFVLMFAAGIAGGIATDTSQEEPNQKVAIGWLCLTYLFFTTGELCISPVGLSTITKISPKKYVSQMMGIWFIAAALGNLIAGRVGGMISSFPHQKIFHTVAMIVLVAGIILVAVSPIIHHRLIGEIEPDQAK